MRLAAYGCRSPCRYSQLPTCRLSPSLGPISGACSNSGIKSKAARRGNEKRAENSNRDKNCFSCSSSSRKLKVAGCNDGRRAGNSKIPIFVEVPFVRSRHCHGRIFYIIVIPFFRKKRRRIFTGMLRFVWKPTKTILPEDLEPYRFEPYRNSLKKIYKKNRNFVKITTF
ncbi:hypothetical protein KPH14_001909 [Odynerus spinipes]|uniref:Uncharacterized protein n=1 Tax=Odynerus spinipes TaxID=1348599 RepID=A0AAD9S0N6_9HYME|nr:hypothetical protein KPH14_001909 [Odynerus spinipes]